MRGAVSRRIRVGDEKGARRSRKSSSSSTGELRKKVAAGVSIQIRSAQACTSCGRSPKPSPSRRILAAGTPEEVVKCQASHTGRFLKPLLERKK